MKKAERQQKIREIITNESIERQEDLVAHLREMGLTVTQATISRDIKEMQLIKIPADNGGYRYGLPAYHHQGHENQLAQTLQDSLEQLKRTVFTTIGDDGNVLVVCMSPEAAIKLEEKLNAMLD